MFNCEVGLSDHTLGLIDYAVGVMFTNSKAKAIVTGHTDSIGSKEYNYQLGLRRAQAVSDELIKAGVDKSRITVESQGEDNPVDTNKTRAGRSRNRRTEILIY